MKTNKLVYGLFGLLALASCSDKMDYSETVVKDKDYVIQTFEKVGGFMTESTVMQTMIMVRTLAEACLPLPPTRVFTP